MYYNRYLLFFSLILININHYVNQKILDHCNIYFFIYEHMSVLEESANAVPRRVMVSEKNYLQAVKILEDAQSVSDG